MDVYNSLFVRYLTAHLLNEYGNKFQNENRYFVISIFHLSLLNILQLPFKDHSTNPWNYTWSLQRSLGSLNRVDTTVLLDSKADSCCNNAFQILNCCRYPTPPKYTCRSNEENMGPKRNTHSCLDTVLWQDIIM